jgi:acyl-CoA reductase-like NAD-dependent aldehyde dehydrogenase
MTTTVTALAEIESRLKALKIETRPFINGVYSTCESGRWLDKISPIDGRALPALSDCDVSDLNSAVQHAATAFRSGSWSNRPRSEKKAAILRLADLVEQEAGNLAYLDALETGRSFRNFFEDSIPKAVQALRWFAEGIDKYYDLLGVPSSNELSLVSREPLGVVGLITPWNDPLVVCMWKLAPALLMGNSVVLKPAEQSSYSMLRVAGLSLAAGIPPGVLNVLPGRGEVIGRALALHMEVRGIFFTGSSTVGKEILRSSGASNMKKVGLECGGKSAFVVSDKCRDLQAAAHCLAKNIFYNQGQICSAPSRAILHSAIADRFINHLANELPRYLPQNPLDPSTLVGAMSSREQYSRVIGYIRHGDAQGYSRIGPAMEQAPSPEGFYIAPTVFLNVPRNDRLAREEIFGPVLVTHTAKDILHAIEIANDSSFGLAASIWSNDIDEALYCARALEAGIVHVNSYGDDDNSAPFGGIKESGLGRDKSLLAFDEYSALKTTWIRFNKPEWVPIP